ncbi:uncharacterized protein LOC119765015 isoform X2 [Culex quinquefasciatus]|uniref:uncharacterized protein LOC119765015 isoform X2 n=1 Tax=Culex quinquefasciatus TaxID=7176 RepID=UPI0018E2DA94|nr:uncharacterized protein LOC119765015 isoform X2 [Culex quinquefasciatus]
MMKPIEFALIACALGRVSAFRHPGESQFIANERTNLDDCRQRFFQYFYASDPFGISGLPARLYEFAHMGAIGWSQPNGTVDWRCGGSLIWDNFVLTAAHCAIDYRNVPPDVVRFGDLNIFTEEGDEYAQQIGIAKFVRHPGHRFSSHYHDIALIRLERNVTINETVLPACLWTDMEVRFKRMDAIGWGKVGFSGEQSPELLKMGLSPISNEECGKVFNKETNRRLRTGLQEHHICASDEKADTCEGDSGGPLQVKLMHNMRETPFIVGVTSFGLPCSPENPGVYTRVASYVDWIVDTMQNHGAVVDDQTFNTTICALRHAPLREYYDGIVTERNGTTATIDVFQKHLTDVDELPSFIAKLDHENCYGVIVDEETVLTTADCADKRIRRIVLPEQIDISTTHVHPRYTKASSDNNIAILKLERLLDFSSDASAVCIWHGTELPNDAFKTVGFGRSDLNTEHFYEGLNPITKYRTSKVTAQDKTNCKISAEHLPFLKRGLTTEHICVGNDFFLVPEVCNLAVGGPLYRPIYESNFRHNFAYGLAQFGRDCGYGEHMIATRLSSHVEWLKSVLLPKQRKVDSDSLIFSDPDLHDGDRCYIEAEQKGRCVPLAKCTDSFQSFFVQSNVKFCSTTSVICCPLDIIESNEQRDLKSD